MVIFKTNLDVILASGQEIDAYYMAASKKINLLLAKYDVRDISGKLEEVSSEKLKALLTSEGFFQATPLKSIFFDQRHTFVPYEIIHAFRGIITDAPKNIRAIFYDVFIKLLVEKGWCESLGRYFEEKLNFPSNGIVILEDLKDFSLGSGVYRVTFQLRDISRRRITVFLKLSVDLQAYNEQLYFYVQKALLVTACHASMPYILSSKLNKVDLILTPSVPGLASDTILSTLVQSYRDNTDQDEMTCIREILEIIIEAFIEHAVLGDLLGRNDRHLMNSLIGFVVNGILQNNSEDDFYSPGKMISFFKAMLKNKTMDFSLIDIDLKWLLGKNNADWALMDIDFGLSELNLLSLLPEFNDYNFKSNPFLEKRKKYLEHYFNLYCKKQVAMLDKKELLFSAVKQFYPPYVLEEKLSLLAQRISSFSKCKTPIVELFKRYLQNYRIRLVYKKTLHTLESMAIEHNNMSLLNALKENNLLKYLPPRSVSSESSVFLKLQCFRGVLTKEDMILLCEKERMPWETVAFKISMIAESHNTELFMELKDNIKFIMNDTAEILKFMHERIQLDSHNVVASISNLTINSSC